MDKFEPVSGSGEMDHAKEAVRAIVIAGGDGAVDLEVTEHALDTVSLLVKHPIMLDLYPAIRPAEDHRIDVPLRKVGTDRIGIIAFVRK